MNVGCFQWASQILNLSRELDLYLIKVLITVGIIHHDLEDCHIILVEEAFVKGDLCG
jgi:hypothetical protein